MGYNTTRITIQFVRKKRFFQKFIQVIKGKVVLESFENFEVCYIIMISLLSHQICLMSLRFHKYASHYRTK